MVLLLVSCRGKPEGQATAPVPSQQVVTRGPVTLVELLDRTNAQVGQRLTLTITATTEPGVDVQMPAIGETLGPFAVRTTQTPLDLPAEGLRLWMHSYTLETFDSGELEIPALTVTFTDQRDDDPIEGELTTEPIVVNVESLMASNDLTAAIDVKDAVPVPLARSGKWWTTAVIVALVAVLALVVLVIILVRLLRNRGLAVKPEPPAHVWALAALDQLEAQGLVEAGRIHEFYVGLTNIVREYIERRFAVHAPERTTDEFLREAQRHPVLGGDHRDALRSFLRSADLVKFAKYRPGPAEIAESSAAARRFVHETAEQPDETLGAAA
jgi:hypothetical protein